MGSVAAIVKRFLRRPKGFNGLLALVLNVTGDAEIEKVTHQIQGTIIMPGDVAIRIKAFGHDRARDIRVAIDMNICAGRTDGGRKIPRWGMLIV